MTNISTSPWMQEILQNESTKKNFIEYRIYRSNHVSHGVIALNRLGAPEARIRQFVDWYNSSMEPPSYSNHHGENPDADPAFESQLDYLLGGRKRFYAILNRFYIKLKDSDSVESFIEKEFPKLSRGMSCSALHGLIYIGYGFNARSSATICEGIAYLHHSYSPIEFDETKPTSDILQFGRGGKDILKVLDEVRSDEVLRKRMLDGANNLAKSDWNSSSFQYRMTALMQAGDVIMSYTNKIRIPNISENHVDVIQVADWLLNQAIAVYTISEKRNDFFLLHGVTGAWSLRQIIPILKHSDAVDALRTFVCVLLATYVIEDSPALTVKIEMNSQSDGESAWRKLIDEAFSSDLDEHIYKLIQVTHDVWNDNQHNDIGQLCIAAAESCLRFDFSL